MSDLQIISELQDISPDSVVLPQGVVENLNTWQVKAMKETVATVSQGNLIMGHTLRVMSKSLHQLKSLIPRGSWVRFCNSNVVPLSSRQIMDLAKGWEGFLSKSELTDGELSTISARSLAKLASADTTVKKEITRRLKAGEKVSDRDIDRLRNTIDNITGDADDENWGAKMNELQVVAKDIAINNQDFRDENERLQKRVERLEVENTKLKAMVSELKAQIADMPTFKVSKTMKKEALV